MSLDHKGFIDTTALAAEVAHHIWGSMAACEAALESGYGSSGLAASHNNLFGTKQHQHPVYGTVSIPTKEFINNQWVVVDANWVAYPDLTSCFVDRMNTLTRLAPVFIHYKNALAAKDAISYVTEVSKTWSTDLQRANKVIAIYNQYFK